MRTFADNLFSAAELMAKGILLLGPDKDVLKSKKHTFISGRFNLSGNWGHTDPRYVELLNRLSQLRGPARYSHQGFSLSTEEASDMLDTADDMFETLGAVRDYRLRRAEPDGQEAPERGRGTAPGLFPAGRA